MNNKLSYIPFLGYYKLRHMINHNIIYFEAFKL